MRITIATGPCFPAPALRGGGMIRTWMTLAETFAANGHEVCLFARKFPGQTDREDRDGYQILRWGGYDQPRWTATSLFLDFFYAALASRKLPRADILVTNDFWMPFLVPRMNTIAGQVVVSVNRYPKHQLGLYKRASLLIVPTHAMARAVEAQHPSWVPRTTCIPNPYDEKAFHPDEAVQRHSHHILFTGRIHPEKGLDLLLKAIGVLHPQTPDLRLTLAGPHLSSEGGGGISYLKHLRRLAAGLPVDFPGPIHEAAQLARLYQSHGIFCYPSLADKGEAMGIAPLEAMACGCVPVVSHNPVFSDWLRSGVNGWSFDHHSPQAVDALAGRLYECLSDEDRLLEMSSAAIHSAQRYRSTVVGDQFLEVFESLVDESR
jgi:glycosyltransferase involved in cell wall biosynthesis